MKIKFRFLFLMSVVLVTFVSGCSSQQVSSTAPVTPPLTSATTIPASTTTPLTTITSTRPTSTTNSPATTAITPATSSSPISSPPITESRVKIVINGGIFAPYSLGIAKGTTVEFENTDHYEYKLICDFPFTAVIITDGVFDFVFDKAGTFTYWIDGAPLVKGTIVVS